MLLERRSEPCCNGDSLIDAKGNSPETPIKLTVNNGTKKERNMALPNVYKGLAALYANEARKELFEFGLYAVIAAISVFIAFFAVSLEATFLSGILLLSGVGMFLLCGLTSIFCLSSAVGSFAAYLNNRNRSLEEQ